MKRRTILPTACTIVAAMTFNASAADPLIALDGFCPVCLVKLGKLIKGEPAVWSVHDGKKYLLRSKRQKRIFDKDPSAFIPAAGGDCVVCKVERDKTVAGKPEFHVVHDGRLFLFPSEKQKEMFRNDPQKYADVDVALGGYCPVCLVNINKAIHGRSEYTSVYDGRRYLFPLPEQKNAFDAEPTTFAPALGGNCTVCKVEMGKDVPGTAKFSVAHGGRLYLFRSAEQQAMFRADPEKYMDADLALKGRCAVCYAEEKKDVLGMAEFAVDFRGKRYLFPDAKHLEKFRINPGKYAKRK